ncbi:MAG: hypothetical protein CMH56_08785 [Myxococcales bacterium]|nr:hypothetical protein [Myxococcales bacterium]|tara:strand:- start:80 stop:802 length:723 start_codon:yes stop_codon:yes gene_type:complete
MSVLQGILSETINQMHHWLYYSGPKLLAAVLVLVVGWLVAKVVRSGSVKVMKIIKLDTISQKTGVDDFLARGNISGGTLGAVSVTIYWLFLLLTLLIAMNLVGITEAEVVFKSVFAVIPKVVLAVVILILGLSFASFMAEVVQTASANAQIRQARMLSQVARYAIIIFVAMMALNQLEIGTEILRNAFLILFGAVCLALSLAFGLGCRELAGEIARGVWEKEQAAQRALHEAATANIPED